MVGIYRSVGSAWLGGTCRFEPSCSAYAAEAFRHHSFFHALTLSLSRIGRCRPGGGYGYDPVPPSKIHSALNCRGLHE